MWVRGRLATSEGECEKYIKVCVVVALGARDKDNTKNTIQEAMKQKFSLTCIQSLLPLHVWEVRKESYLTSVSS